MPGTQRPKKVRIFQKRLTWPKTSEYTIYHTDNPGSLRTLLEAAFGIRGVVRKTREIFMKGRTRIHLDQVQDLGEFLELEVVLETGESPEVGRSEAHDLMALLKISPENLVASAYVDLLTPGVDPILDPEGEL